MDPQPLFIDGAWHSTGAVTEIRLPFNGELSGLVHFAGPAEVDLAVAAAQRAAPVLAEMSNAERSDLLLHLHRILEPQREEIARAITLETGKPIQEGRLEVSRALETLFTAALEARQLTGEAVPIDGSPAGRGRWAMTLREPRGVIAAITPFNVPFNLAMHKIAPALGSGNAIIHKPSEQTPLSALFVARAMVEAGAPRGAYNLLPGLGETVGQGLVRHPGVAMITFTGSAEVGRLIKASAGLKKVTLELGGNSAVLIDADADLDLAVSRSITGAFLNSGQLCISVQRIYAHEAVYQAFRERFTAAAAGLRVGHPLAEDTAISSLISEEAAVRVSSWIDEVAPGQAHRERATVTPAVVDSPRAGSRLDREEVFGPVVATYRYQNWDAAIAAANATPYGLQAGVFTRDIGRAFEAARKLRVGGVIINDIPTFRADPMPYGGTKESGEGREGPRYAMQEMTETKLIVWR